MPDSETVRAALRAAEKSMQDAIDTTDDANTDDRQAAKELEGARDTVRRWLDALEAGRWPGRSVAPYPSAGERISDGT